MTLGLLANAPAARAASLIPSALRAFGVASSQLSSGLAMDGKAATKAVHGKFTTRSTVLAQAVKNAQQGAAMLDTALSATKQLKGMLDSGKSITTLCNSSALSDADRGLSDQAFQKIFGAGGGFQKAVDNGRWGDTSLFGGAAGAGAGNLTLSFQVGASSVGADLMTVDIPGITLAALFGTAPGNITDMASAQAEDAKLDAALVTLDTTVANLEATRDQLTAAGSASEDTLANTQSAISVMGDTNVVEAMQEKETAENKQNMAIAVAVAAMSIRRSALGQIASVVSGR